MNIKEFLKYYLISMRLHFGFITGIAGLVGMAYYDYLSPGSASWFRKFLIFLSIFFSYGVNQVINDYFGLEEDRHNAPNRPMVRGLLHPQYALYFSYFLMLAVALISYWLNPWSVVAVILGVIFNLIYEHAKAWGLWANFFFGLSISMCTIYSFLAMGKTLDPFITHSRLAAFFLVFLCNALMTYFTYFKDYEGDRLAGKKTFIVRHGLQRSRVVGLLGSFLPSLFFLLFIYLDLFTITNRDSFYYCATVTLFLQLWTGYLYYKYPSGKETYFNLVTNIRACVAGEIALIALFNGLMALYLLSASYIFIGFLFDLHKDHKA